MSVKLRLSRGGSKKNPHYSVVAIPSTARRDGQFIEKIGHYHPCQKNEARLTLNKERCLYWLSVGAQPTETVVRLMKKYGVLLAAKYDVEKVKSQHMGVSKKEIKQMLKQRKEQEVAAKKAKEQAKKEAEAAAKAAAANVAE
jgi:small subunit ribosomal protein S16